MPPLQFNFSPLLGILGTQEIIILLAIIAVIIIIISVAAKEKTPPNMASNNTSLNSSNQQTVVVVNEGKSVGLAFLLAFLFGPLGLLYASVTGGIIMIILAIVIGFATLGMGLIFTWIISIIWAVVAASDSKANATTVVTNNGYPSPPTPNMKTDKETLLNQLSQLHDLKEKGVLSDEIYERERRQILDRMG